MIRWDAAGTPYTFVMQPAVEASEKSLYGIHLLVYMYFFLQNISQV